MTAEHSKVREEAFAVLIKTMLGRSWSTVGDGGQSSFERLSEQYAEGNLGGPRYKAWNRTVAGRVG